MKYALILMAAILAACTTQEPERFGTQRQALVGTEVFQQGVDGYTGTLDTFIQESSPSAANGSADAIEWDSDDPWNTGQFKYALLRFSQVFTSEGGTVPDGSTITSATLTLEVHNSGANGELRESAVSWTEATTYGNFGGDSGVQASELGAVVSSVSGSMGTLVLDVTSSLSAWSSNPSQNLGWVFVPGGSNGVDARSSEYGTASARPELSVTYDDGQGSGGAGGSSGGGSGGAAAGSGGSAGTGGSGGSGGSAGAGGFAGMAGSGGSGGAPSISGTHIWAAGDIGDCTTTTDTLTGGLFAGNSAPIFVLGDIAYVNGSINDFNNCFDPAWGAYTDRMTVALGNHEYLTAGATGCRDYFGEQRCGPEAGYYSYNLDDWHVVVLNTSCNQTEACALSDAQRQWLANDLRANTENGARPIVAIAHHPRFSSGLHGDQPVLQEAWQMLDVAGGCVFLSGHDHNYERFAPQDFAGLADAAGMTQFVVGTGGTSLRNCGTPNANSEALNCLNQGASHGVLDLTLGDGQFAWEFVSVNGSFTDSGVRTCF